MLRSSVRLIYTSSRDTLSLTEDWKQKLRAELKKSASLIGTTGLISPAPSDWWKLQRGPGVSLAVGLLSRMAQAEIPTVLASGSSVLYTEAQCRIHQSPDPGAP